MCLYLSSSLRGTKQWFIVVKILNSLRAPNEGKLFYHKVTKYT